MTVLDTTAPVLGGMPADITGVVATGTAGAAVTYDDPTATDLVDGPVSPVCTPASGSTFTLGTTTVSCMAADVAGNLGTASFYITVTATADEPPAVPANLKSGVTTVSVVLDWDDNTEPDLAGYRVYRRVAGGSFDQLTASLLGTSAFTDATAPTQVALEYRVVAVDLAGNASNPATIATQRDIWFRGSATAQNGGKTNSITVPKPTGTQANDLLVTVIDVRGAAAVSPPSGWVLARQDVSGNAVRQVTYYRMAGASEPASYTWGLSAKQGASAVSAAYGGVNPDQPFDASGGRPAANAAQITAPSITTTVDGALLIGAFGIGTNASITPPSGMIGQASATMNSGQNKLSTQLADQLLGSAGATGDRVATASTAAPNIGQAIAFRPSTVVPPDDTQPPTQPTGLTATAPSETLVNLAWLASTDNVGVVGYLVYRDGAQIVGLGLATTYADTSVASNTSYRYQVRAVDAAGNLSAPSNQATVTTPGAPPPPPAPRITFVSASNGANRVATSVVLPRPSGIQVGDILVASVDVGGSQVITPPVGWTWIRTDTANGQLTKATYWRLVTNTEPGSWTWTFPESAAASGVVAAYRGVDGADPIVANGGQASAAASAAIVAPSVTVGVPDTRLVALYGTATNATITPPSSMAKRSEVVSGGRLKMTSALADEVWSSAGTTGARQATASKAAANIGHLIVLRPAP